MKNYYADDAYTVIFMNALDNLKSDGPHTNLEGARRKAEELKGIVGTRKFGQNDAKGPYYVVYDPNELHEHVQDYGHYKTAFAAMKRHKLDYGKYSAYMFRNVD